MNLSQIADSYCLAERCDLVFMGRNKFLGHVAFKAGFVDRFHDSRIVQLLGFINFMTARYTAGVVMRNSNRGGRGYYGLRPLP